ncbi:putative retrotransposon hot spot (RHS) protein, partial [Trypanosoma conorhini]
MWRSFVRFHVAMRQKLCVSIVPARAAAVRPRGVRSIPQPQLCVAHACARWPPAGGVRGALHPSFLLMEQRRVSGGGAQVAQGQGREQGNKQQWTLTSTVEEVLLEGEGPLRDIKLNDFLRDTLNGRGVVEANENLSIENFVAQPEAFVTNKNDRRLILASPSYKAVKKAIEGVHKLRADARRLMEHRVGNLQHWKEFAQKSIVFPTTRTKLRSALAAAEGEEARLKWEATATATFAPVILEGFYDSVFNATWSHVLEVPQGKGGKKAVRMQVKEGEPPMQSWVYDKDRYTFLPVNDAEQFRPPRPRLMILDSKKGWPYVWMGGWSSNPDFFINCEVERVWRIVEGDLNRAFRTEDLKSFRITRRLLIGTPGIGKSMAAGSYLLYQLLHYDDEKLQVVVYCFGGGLACVFDKTTRTVAEYMGREDIAIAIGGLVRRGMKGYIIYDVSAKEHSPLPSFSRSAAWGMIVLSSPKLRNYQGWEKQVVAKRIIMNCPEKLDVKAMCAWEMRDKSAEEQAQYWTMVEERMNEIGPIPRYIFNKKKYKGRVAAVKSALKAIRDLDVSQYFTQGNEKPWYSENPSHKLVKIVRAVEDGSEFFYNKPICRRLGGEIL